MDVADKLDVAIERNRDMVWEKNPQSEIACGKCEAVKPHTARIGYYMCASCEDLLSGR